MSTLNVSDLFIYPIKSTFRIPVNNILVNHTGLQYDRLFALINSQNKVITARENKSLFGIKTIIDQTTLTLYTTDEDQFKLSLKDLRNMPKDITIFKDRITAKLITHEVNDWISNRIGETCQLVTIGRNTRPMKSKYNGREGDYIGFKDASAIHLITTASVNELNSRLKDPVTPHHFRPNIVVTGFQPYEEELWKLIRIGNCEFEVAVKTSRCPMTTIDPETLEKHKRQEPLKTLAKFKKEQHKVNFGIYLIPRKLGTIKKGDTIDVISRML